MQYLQFDWKILPQELKIIINLREELIKRTKDNLSQKFSEDIVEKITPELVEYGLFNKEYAYCAKAVLAIEDDVDYEAVKDFLETDQFFGLNPEEYVIPIETA